ncbi:MAG: hypothetical protein AMK73_05870 [Planctomycetes bacterium SM23_32]|nr:MAG: hypothetical protein AMK73_05870 [Planctomycetes bacterium SM23_32]
MARHGRDTRGPIGALSVGSELAGLELCRLVAGDDFSSLWLTAPLDEGFADSCIRAIPAYNLQCSDAYQRMRSEMSFWRNLSGRSAVNLYECGKSGAYYFIQMRYMTDGSLADQLEADDWEPERLTDLAVAFAAVLRDLHADSGAHGNLKPTNVFPVRHRGVLLSDFAIPLWFDELEAGCKAIQPRLLHQYRAPEQYENPRDFDTRSDVYAFGLILTQCLTGIRPEPGGEPPDLEDLSWPEGLGQTVRRCLSRDRNARPADGFELFEALGRSTRYVRPIRRPGDTDLPAPALAVPPSYRGGGGEEIELLLQKARELVGEGRLEEAVQVLESLPPGTEGVAELTDQVERRHRECEELVEEAVRLAGLGERAAAAEIVREAEQRWPHSRTLAAVKAELLAAEEEEAAGTGVPDPLAAALESGRYAAARSMLEKLIREGPLSTDLRRAVEKFKKGRVRRAFLDNINTARRLYVLGHHDEAAEHWLEAARWLPGSPERERLRRIAGVARKGRLRLDVQDAAVAAAAAGGVASGLSTASRQAPKVRWSRAKWRWMLVGLAVAAFLLVAGLTLLWGQLAD